MSVEPVVPRLLASNGGVEVYHADHLSLLAALPRREDGTVCDMLPVDAPYSGETHDGHDDGAQTANRATDWARRAADAGGARHLAEQRYAAAGKGERRKIDYACWTAEDVAEFMRAWAPVTRGWIVSITDHLLFPVWYEEAKRVGRYPFPPLPYYAPGRAVRMNKDGPSGWTYWIMVARPRNEEFSHWGTLRGGYILPKGAGCGGKKRLKVVGGKHPWAMREIVRDYSRVGDLVCDPVCGAGTTLRAAQELGRRAVGGDMDEAHALLAAEAISKPFQVESMPVALPPTQRSLYDLYEVDDADD